MCFVGKLSLSLCQDTLVAAVLAGQHATLTCMSAPSKALTLAAPASVLVEVLRSWAVANVIASSKGNGNVPVLHKVAC